jgi:hypothetical protein
MDHATQAPSGQNGQMAAIAKGLEGLRRLRWWLLAPVVVLGVLVRDEWAWWSAIAGAVALAGFWIPGLVDLVRDWSPSARRARAQLPPEHERIEAARQELLRRKAD